MCGVLRSSPVAGTLCFHFITLVQIQIEQEEFTEAADKSELRALEFPSTEILYLTTAKLFT